MNQQVVSAEQSKSLGCSLLMELNSQETSQSDRQERAVPDSQGRVHKEGSQVKTLSRKETLVIHSTAVCGRQRSSPGDNQDALSGRQLTSPERDHVRPFSGHQPWDEDHLVTSVFDQTIKEKDQEMPVTGDQTPNLDR